MTKKQKEKLIDILSEVYYHKETFGGGYRKIMPLIEKLLKAQAEEITISLQKDLSKELKYYKDYYKEYSERKKQAVIKCSKETQKIVAREILEEFQGLLAVNYKIPEDLNEEEMFGYGRGMAIVIQRAFGLIKKIKKKYLN